MTLSSTDADMNIAMQLKLNNIREFLTGILYPRVCPVCGQTMRAVSLRHQQIRTYLSEVNNDRQSLVNHTKHFLHGERAHDYELHPNPESDVQHRGSANPYICPDCYKKLDFAEGKARCMRCSKPLDEDNEEFCPDCLKRRRTFESGRAVMMHNDAARKILYDLKYANMKDNADCVAYEAAARFGKLIAMQKIDAIVPVPLHKKRRLKRGYNQAEVIARRFAFFMEMAGYPKISVDTGCLKRIKSTGPLKELSGEKRREDLQGAFEVRGQAAGRPMANGSVTAAQVAGGRADDRQEGMYQRVLIVDDIFTTGATIGECAEVLKAAGVREVYFLTASIGS